MRRTKIVAAAELIENGEKPLRGTTTVSLNASDLLALARYDDAEAEISNIDQIINFGATPFNVPSDNNAIYHLSPSNYFNHKTDAANVIISLDAGDVCIVAVRDIKSGEELFQDYRTFEIPEWFKTWTTNSTAGQKLDTATLGKMLAAPDEAPPLKP